MLTKLKTFDFQFKLLGQDFGRLFPLLKQLQIHAASMAK